MFTVLHDNNTTVTSLSLVAKDFTANYTSLELADDHYLYVGFYKQFKNFYIELKPQNIIPGTLNFEYWNGTAWASLEVVDETQNFFKSGFIYFNKPSDWTLSTFNNLDNFYIRMQPTATHSIGVILRGLGVLFSNDLDLEGIKSNIVTKLNDGESWVGKHEAARKYIIQKLRNLGYRKYVPTESNNPVFSGDSIYFSNINEFDLLEPFELREASKFYALSYIYLDELSDEQDDKYERAGKRHLLRADENINLFMLKVDSDDNGIEDENETSGDTGTNLTWV